jgi:hypothetical protein
LVITDRFVYVHLPKTGGTFVETVLRQALASRSSLFIDTSRREDRLPLRVRDQHSPVSDIPELDRSKKVLFTVRNPYDHYVSYYEFGWWKDYPGDTFDELRIRTRFPNYPEITFAQWLEANFDWDLLSGTYYDAEIADEFRRANMGPLSFEYVRYMFRRPDRIIADLANRLEQGRCRTELADIHFIRTENLNRELHDFLVAMGYEREGLGFMLDLDKIYPDHGPRRKSRPWQEYYNAHLKSLVREKERLLFEMFPQYD